MPLQITPRKQKVQNLHDILRNTYTADIGEHTSSLMMMMMLQNFSRQF